MYRAIVIKRNEFDSCNEFNSLFFKKNIMSSETMQFTFL